MPNPLERLRHGKRFAEIVAGAVRLPLLRTGIHQGLFEALRTPQTAASLAERLGLTTDLVEAWLRAAHAHDLVTRRGEEFAIGAFTRWLLDAPEAAALHAALDQVALAYVPRLQGLAELMKGAERPAYGSSAEAARVAAASRLVERRALASLSRVPGARKARRVLDVGCGHGTYLAGFLRRYRDAHGLGVEIDPEVAEEARRTLREAEVWRRAEVRSGDFMKMELPLGGYGLVLVNNSLHYFPPGEHDALFRRILERLVPGGVLAVQTPVVSDTRLARSLGTLPAVSTLDLYLRTHRDLHGLPPPDALAEALRAAGFAELGEVRILPGGTARYVWARAPS